MDSYFLITNWHVLTGRNPQEPSSLLDGYPASPSAISIYLPHSSNQYQYTPSELMPLYHNGNACWIEAEPYNPPVKSRIDLAAIKVEGLNIENGPHITCINDFAPGPKDFLRVGKDIVIIGYPFGISAENPFPMWKRGYLASEPSIAIGGMLKYYIDSPGRPGMSGAPIFMIGYGPAVSSEVAARLNSLDLKAATEALISMDSEQLFNAPEVNVMKFAGVYSGSVGDQSLEKLRIGVAWHAGLVDRIFSNPIDGTNPYPPIF